MSGSYTRDNNKFIVNTRGHMFWDGVEPARSINIKFNATELNQISYSDWRSLDILRLEPLEIGAIYPSHKEDRILVKVDEVPPLLIAALVATEDHRFYDHYGVSISAIMRAAIKNIKSGSVVQGGSTITQQLVKNYYLSLDRSFSRKITEALMSLLLEFHYEKNEVEIAYFGILEEYQNKKLGSFLLSEAIKKSFNENINRVWLHTCSLDHKNALNNYIARGMKIFKSEIVKI